MKLNFFTALKKDIVMQHMLNYSNDLAKEKRRIQVSGSNTCRTYLEKDANQAFKTDLPYLIGSSGWNKPPDWLVENLFQTGTVGFVVGDSKDFKTFLMIYLSYCVALGINAGPLRVKKGRVLYICGEGEGSFPKRLKAIERSFHLEVGANLITVPRPVALMSDIEREKLESLVQQFEPSLVVIDTFSQSGIGVDENRAESVAQYINHCTSIAKKYSTTVINVHHRNKDGGFRGSSALLANVDFVLETSRDKSVDSGFATKLSVTKSKDSSTDVAYRFSLQAVPLNVKDNFGKEISTLVVDDIIATKVGTKTNQDETDRKFILAALSSKAGSSISQNSLKLQLKAQNPAVSDGTIKKRVSNACTSLVKDSLIAETKYGISKSYSLSGATGSNNR